jgi:hypothetical protein
MLFLVAALSAAVLVVGTRSRRDGSWGYRTVSRDDGDGPYRSTRSTSELPNRAPAVLVVAGIGGCVVGLALAVFIPPLSVRAAWDETSSSMTGFLVLHALAGVPIGVGAMVAGLSVSSPARLDRVRRLSLLGGLYAVTLPFRAVHFEPLNAVLTLGLAVTAVLVCALLYASASRYLAVAANVEAAPSIPMMSHRWRRARWRRRY